MKSTSRYAVAVMALGFALGSTWDKAAAGDPGGNFMVRLQGTYLDTQDKTKSATSRPSAMKPRRATRSCRQRR